MNISFSCIESRVDKNQNIYGRFILAPFIPGHAVTLANGLRRCLLSEVYGVAITAIEINGITHEYSTITGIRESVLDILLNVKQIVLTSELQFQRPQIAFLQVQGPGIVRASDIKLPISIQNVKPEQHIATLLYDGVLNMKFMICCGKKSLVQTPRGLRTPKVLKQTLRHPNNNIKTTIVKKKKQIKYTKFSTYLKKDKNLDQNKPNIFSKNAGKSVSNFVLTSLSLKKKETIKRDTPFDKYNNRLIINNKINKHIKRKKRIRYLDGLTLLKKKNINTYKDYLIKFCKKKKKDLVFTDYLIKLRQKKLKSYLPIDAVFAPVSKVNFAIENNDLSNAPKERINLEIWTNGSIHPIQAIIEAAKAFTDITLFLKDITNKRCLFINSPNSFINMLFFKKSLNHIIQRNKEIQKHYLTIFAQNKKRIGGVKTSIDGVPELSNDKIPIMSKKGKVKWVDPNDPFIRDLKVNIDGKKKRDNIINIMDPKTKTLSTAKERKKRGIKKIPNNPSFVMVPVIEKLNLIKPGKEKIQLKTGVTKKRKLIKYKWVTRARTIREFFNMLPQPLISTELAKNLKIEYEQINKKFNQYNSRIDIGNLGLSLRPYTCLKKAKIENLGDLLQNSAEDLLNLKNFGKMSLNEVENILNQYNLKLSSQKIEKKKK